MEMPTGSYSDQSTALISLVSTASLKRLQRQAALSRTISGFGSTLLFLALQRFRNRADCRDIQCGEAILAVKKCWALCGNQCRAGNCTARTRPSRDDADVLAIQTSVFAAIKNSGQSKPAAKSHSYKLKWNNQAFIPMAASNLD